MKKVGCDSPSCIITKPTSNNMSRLLRVSIKPEGDVEGNTWVDSSQIERILNSWRIYKILRITYSENLRITFSDIFKVL